MDVTPWHRLPADGGNRQGGRAPGPGSTGRAAARPPSQDLYLSLAQRLETLESRAVLEHHAAVAPILSALRTLCAACVDCCAEIERQERARAAAVARERHLRHDIGRVLESLAYPAAAGDVECEPRGPPSPALDQAAERAGEQPSPGAGGWRRLQALFRSELDRLIRAGGEKAGPGADPAAAPGAPRAAARDPDRAMIVYCLGRFEVFQGEQLVEGWSGQKAQSVFKYLLLHRRHRVPKDVLFELFWAGHSAEASRRNLHQAIYSLRHTLRAHRPDSRYVLFEDECYLLNPEVEIWIDAEEFDERVAAGRRLEELGRHAEAMAEYARAEGLYRGPLLEECLYEDWVSVERERLKGVYRELAGRLAEHYVNRDHLGAAAAMSQKALMVDRCDEEAHRRLMRCYAAQGQPHLASRQYLVCAEALREDFAMSPSPETIALHDRLIHRPALRQVRVGE